MFRCFITNIHENYEKIYILYGRDIILLNNKKVETLRIKN